MAGKGERERGRKMLNQRRNTDKTNYFFRKLNKTCKNGASHIIHPISRPSPAVPPDIIDRESSGDLTIREGQDVTLTCRAKGHPTPSIVWRREDNQDIVLDSDKAGEAD